MKAILEFNLPEDRNEYTITTRAVDMYIDLTEIADKIRSFDKYGLGLDLPEENTEEWCKEISKLVNEIWSLSHKNTRDIE